MPTNTSKYLTDGKFDRQKTVDLAIDRTRSQSPLSSTEVPTFSPRVGHSYIYKVPTFPPPQGLKFVAKSP